MIHRARLLIVFCALLAPAAAHSQGCNECRETVGQTPVRTQTAYRRAILLMVFYSAGIFTASVVILRRFR